MKKATLLLLMSISALLLLAQNPVWEWVKPVDSNIDWFMDLDEVGNIYVTGAFNSTMVFDDITLTTNGKNDIFLAKMSTDGNWLWAKQIGGPEGDSFSSLCLDKAGNIFLSGRFSGTVNFGDLQLTEDEKGDLFIAKMNAQGNWLWAKQTGGNSNAYIRYLAADETGNLFVSGQFGAKATIGDSTLVSYATNFISKLDEQGNWLWTKRIDSKSEIPHPVSVDRLGNLYLAGNFTGMVTIADSLLGGSRGRCSFVAKLNPEGKLQWVARNATEWGTIIWSIAADAEGNSYITGTGHGKLWFDDIYVKCGLIDIIVAKVDPNGKWEWVRHSKDKDYAMSTSVCVDKDGNPFISGTFENKTKLGSFKLKSQKGWDLVVAKLDKSGKWMWAELGKSAGFAEGHTIKADNEGNAVLIGQCKGEAEFGSIKLSGTDEEQAFIGKIRHR
ncbi:MAG: hypothetical protein R6V77_03600 [Candidatus Cloacimonadaceae bacterium]